MDPASETQRLLHKFVTDDIYFLETFLRIVDEEGDLVPFRTRNRPMQADFAQRVIVSGVPKVIELKARRVGGTSLFQGLGLTRCMKRRNYNVLLLAQSDPDSRAFMKAGFRKLYDDMIDQVEMPDGSIFKPKVGLLTSSEHEMSFANGSRIDAGTAGSVKFGRGRGYDMVIGTEVARWDVGRPPGTAEETWSMAIGALGDKPDILAILESTAYGAAGYYYDIYQGAKSGENGYLALFYDWRWHPAYAYEEDDPRALIEDKGDIRLTEEESALGLTKAQARWRRAMIAELGLEMFKQEFPEDDETCFRVSGDPYFDIQVVDKRITECRPVLSTSESGRMRIWQGPRVGERYIVACDPGGEGVERKFASQERDFDAVGVFDSRLNHVATLHGRWDTQTLGNMAVDLCRYYNDALFIGESGPYGDAVLLVVGTVLGYRNIYYERDEKGKPMRAGKRTDVGSKPALLDNLKSLVEQNVFRSDDKALWGEFRNYHRVPTPAGKVRLEARAGHDDLVIMAALGAWAWHEGNFGRRTRYRTKIHLPDGVYVPAEEFERPSDFTDTKKGDLLRQLEGASG